MKNTMISSIVVLACLSVGALTSDTMADNSRVITNETVASTHDSVKAYLATLPPPKKLHAELDSTNKQKKVFVDGVQIHTAKNVAPNYSSVSNVVYAIESYSTDLPSRELADVDSSGRVQFAQGEIWIKRRNEPMLRVSPPNLHAGGPCLSPDGSFVVFTGIPTNEKGIYGRESLYLVDLRTTPITPEIVIVVSTPEGRIAPLAWINGNTLAVYRADNHDGARERIERVILKMNP